MTAFADSFNGTEDQNTEVWDQTPVQAFTDSFMKRGFLPGTSRLNIGELLINAEEQIKRSLN
jgi:hypothetical protein